MGVEGRYPSRVPIINTTEVGNLNVSRSHVEDISQPIYCKSNDREMGNICFFCDLALDTYLEYQGSKKISFLSSLLLSGL